LFREAERADWSYPARYGYAMLGRTMACGPDVTSTRPGDLVFAYAHHGTHAIVAQERVVPLGGLPDPHSGVLFALLNIAYVGALDARPPLGADVVVTGLGVVGQLMVRLLARCGLRTLVAVDGIASRRALAQAGGATHVLDPTADKVAETVRDLTAGRGADVVVEASGAAPALNEAIRTAGYNALVVAMSWYGGTFESLDLSAEFHHNRVRILSSQSAAISPELGPLWTLERRRDQVRRWLSELDLAPLISHRIPFAQASSAYELLDTAPERAMQVVLTYGD